MLRNEQCKLLTGDAAGDSCICMSERPDSVTTTADPISLCTMDPRHSNRLHGTQRSRFDMSRDGEAGAIFYGHTLLAEPPTLTALTHGRLRGSRRYGLNGARLLLYPPLPKLMRSRAAE